MRKVIIVLFLLVSPAFAANWYVLKGATGTAAGTSWTNAWTEFNQVTGIACGDTVWIGGGTYTTSMSINKTCTSGTVLTIESVLATDTVPTSAPGYTTAVLNQVIGNSASIDVQGAYITVSGRKGTIGTEGTFGIVLQCTSGNACGPMTVGTSVNSSNITLTEIELYGPPCVTSGGSGIGSCTGDTHGVDHGSNSVTNLTMDHMWMHRFAEIVRPYQWTNWVIQYSDLDTTRQTPDEHEDIVYAANPSAGTMAYNIIWGSPNDGIFFDFGGNSLTYYGNVYYHSGGAFITFKTGYSNGAVVMYNNTFSSDTTFGDYVCPSNCPWIDWTGTPSSVNMENNIFDHVAFSGSPGAGDYNFYSTDVGLGDSGTHSATYTSAFPPSNTQFISINTSNPIASNYQLTSTGQTLFASGATLSAPYNADMLGVTRGVNGWTIGAYQTPSPTTTWYIRTDGGTKTQCTGTTNAPYPGSGTGLACAVNHLYWLLNQSTWLWLVGAGDTIQFEDVGPYYMGLTDGTYGQSWAHCAGDAADCFPPPLPTSVKVYGKNVGSCHNSNHTALTNPTQLIGINFLYEMWDLHSTNGIDMECLDISQLSNCTTGGGATSLTITNTSLTANVATYNWSYSTGNWVTVGEPITVTGSTNGGGIFNVSGAFVTGVTGSGTSTGTFTIALTHADVTSAADTGTVGWTGQCNTAGSNKNTLNTGIAFQKLSTDSGPDNLTLKDIAVHGTRNNGISGGAINGSPSDVTNISDVYLFGNGSAGWTYDAINGGCSSSPYCLSQGTINVSYMTVEWSGCKEVEPNGGTYGGNGYNYCVDQAYGGYGDAFTLLSTGGVWNWSHINAIYNAQDGFDSLHVGDDHSVQPTVNASYIYSMGNEGQSIKGGGGLMTLTNSIGIANCLAFQNASNFPGNPTGWNSLVGQMCRAADAMAFGMQDGNTLTIENVTNISGDQNTAWDMATNGCTTNCIVIMKNNTTMGFSSPAYGGQYPQAFNYGTGGNPFSNASSVIRNNAWFHTGSSGTTCPGTSYENPNPYVCTDPKFAAESDVNAMNVQLTSSSPLIGAGVAIPGLTTDFAGNPRPNPPSIGAYEFLSSPVSSPTNLSGKVILGGKSILQ